MTVHVGTNHFAGSLLMFNNFKNSIRGINSPHQLALGVAIGAIIGLIPKDSAFPYLFVVVLLLTRGNLLCGIISAVAFSFIGPLLDPVSHAIGFKTLSVTEWQSFYSDMQSRPWIPWTRFENTVVTGSLILGVAAWLPIYLLSRWFFQSWGVRWIRKLADNRVARWFTSGMEAELDGIEDGTEILFADNHST